MKTRTLKIESAGDYWRGRVTPKIRLTGQWLERAGFKAGNHVVVQISQPGTITLQFVDHSIEGSKSNQSGFPASEN